MHAVYAFGVLILLAFLGTRFIYRKSRSPSPLDFLFISGLVYVFLGLFLGEQGLDILSPDVLEGFAPLVSLGLGWIGFLFGFQLEGRYLRCFPRRYMVLSLLQFLCNFLLAFFILDYALGSTLAASAPPFLRHGMATAFGLLASLNSPTLLNTVVPALPARGDYAFLARFLSSVGAFWGITGLALLQSFWRLPFSQKFSPLQGLLLLLSATAFPVLLGRLFHYLTAKRVEEEDLLVYLLGLVFFVSGTAVFFNQAPLYCGMILGITFSNLTKKQEKIYPILLSTEKPLFVILLILIGALWRFRFDAEVLAPALLLLFSGIAGNTLPLPLLGRALNFPFRLPFRFGLCFMSAGGIGVAFAVGFRLAYPIPESDVFLAVSLLAVVAAELLSPGVIRAVLTRLDSKP